MPLAWTYGRGMRVVGAMGTADGTVRVEVVRHRRTDWYRLTANGQVQDHLSIASVQRLLREAGVELADLRQVEVSSPAR